MEREKREKEIVERDSESEPERDVRENRDR